VITDKLRALWKTVFGDSDAFLDAFFAIAYSPDRCHYLTVGEDVVSALYWFDCSYSGGKLAYIYAVATDPDHRGKGLASRLIEETHNHLRVQGYAGAVLKPAKGLFPFYERLGYVRSGYIHRFSAQAGNPVSLKEVSAAEFSQLRRKYLPEDGVRQEDITLDFLHSFAHFYACDEALVCACPQENLVFEYLGNPHLAPGILGTLGISEAEIPTIGQEIPHTMFFPLNCTKIPGYLGITLE
jgi:GNAT superfamily N-acetyltransferase